MDPERFAPNDFGTLRYSEVDKFHWFDPTPLPNRIELSTETALALSRADDALGRLGGVGRVLRDKDTLIRLYFMKEALASSRIEGTQAEMSDAFQAEGRPQMQRKWPEVATVLSLIAAMQRGLREVHETGSVTTELALHVHSELVKGPHSGVVRDQTVWIGSPTDRPETADFVPPLADHLSDALQAWERFSTTSTEMPPLIRAALLHYQFLTIHPFRDGNGRVARALVLLFLTAEGRLPEPLLYLSPYLESKRREYGDRLQAVRERGAIQEWLQFFLTTVEKQALDGVDRAERLLDLMQHYREDLAGSRSRSVEVVDLLFKHGVINAALVRESLGMSHQGALNLIRGLERRGWLVRSPATGQGGARYWLAIEVIEAVERDAGDETAERSSSETGTPV